MPKFVFLWTDAFLWGLALVILVYLVFISRRVALRSAWLSVVRTPSAAAAGVILLIFFFIGLLDSIHYRPLLPASNQAQQETQHYAPFVRSTLDELLGFVGLDAKERSYSAPFARTLFFKETQLIDDEPVRDFPPLVNAAHEITDDVTHRARLLYLLGQTLLWSAVFVVLLRLLLFTMVRILHPNPQPKLPSKSVRNLGTARSLRGVRPVRLWRLPAAVNAVWISLSLIGLVLIAVAIFSPHFYVLGTDRSGNDVIYQAIKSIRTAWVIGTLTTVAMLPPALFFGIAAGYFKGWVDDLIQYLYTTLTSIPGVLLIAACVLMMQVYIDGHPEYFDT
ncbi:MAG TPA: ABC transporter permease, partial [Paenalcaligenes sp.]|nr:ABC transporter permease [Paenalcaligenes sp.]